MKPGQNPYLSLASRVQSRVAKRARNLAIKEEYRQLYKFQKQQHSFKEVNAELKELKEHQILDKEIYHVLVGEAMAYEDMFGEIDG